VARGDSHRNGSQQGIPGRGVIRVGGSCEVLMWLSWRRWPMTTARSPFHSWSFPRQPRSAYVDSFVDQESGRFNHEHLHTLLSDRQTALDSQAEVDQKVSVAVAHATAQADAELRRLQARLAELEAAKAATAATGAPSPMEL
jgi:hypothetical protein